LTTNELIQWSFVAITWIFTALAAYGLVKSQKNYAEAKLDRAELLRRGRNGTLRYMTESLLATEKGRRNQFVGFFAAGDVALFPVHSIFQNYGISLAIIYSLVELQRNTSRAALFREQMINIRPKKETA